jgi:hypothetical protein
VVGGWVRLAVVLGGACRVVVAAVVVGAGCDSWVTAGLVVVVMSATVRTAGCGGAGRCATAAVCVPAGLVCAAV